MMFCPECGGKTTVKDTVPNTEDKELYRRRVCRDCGHVFYSVEFETEPTARFEHIFRKLRSQRTMSYLDK